MNNIDLAFNIDLDAEAIYIIVDNSITLSVTIDDEIKYTGFKRLDDDELADLIKQFCRKIFEANDLC